MAQNTRTIFVRMDVRVTDLSHSKRNPLLPTNPPSSRRMNTLLEKYIAKVVDKRTKLREHSLISPLESCRIEDQLYGYDRAISDIQSLLPELIKEVVEETRKNIRDFSEENKTDERVGAMFYGMKVMSSPLVPKDQIWFNNGEREIKFDLASLKEPKHE